MTPLDRHIERLQAMRAAGNGSSDFATDLLDVLDGYDQDARAQPLFDEIADIVSAVKCDGPDTADRVQFLFDEMDELRNVVDVELIDEVRPAVQALEDLRADMLVLLVEAGIAEPNVMPDDPIGILRMFLPVE